jgi:prepilin-type N-terminal cleavage/methylation domain-containing protein
MISRIGKRESNRYCRAFTLIELVLVMALLSIVLAFAFPSLANFFRTRSLDSEARRFLSLTHYGHHRAVSEGVPMMLWIDVKRGAYGLEAETGYVETDDKAVEYSVGENLQLDVPRESIAPASNQRTARSVRGNLPAIRFTVEGFVTDSSPAALAIRRGKDDMTWIAQSPNRISYEIRADRHASMRR